MSIVGNSDEERKEQEQDLPASRGRIWMSPPVENQVTNGQLFEDVTRWLGAILGEGQVAEMRALRVGEGRFRQTYAGFFDGDHLKEMAREALLLTAEAEGVYFSLNPLNRDLLSRKC